MTKLPHIFVAELTSRCNHGCLFCSCPWETQVQNKKQDLSTEAWKDILDKMRSIGCQHVTFTGGEVSMRADLFDILEHAKKIGFTIGVISNGKLIDDNFLYKLKYINPLLSISVPGIETFLDTTKCDGINHTLKLFEKCKDMGITTVANITVTKKNLYEIYDNVALPIVYGASYVLINRFLPGGRGLDNLEYLLDNSEINLALRTVETVLEKAGINGHVGTELPYCIIDNPSQFKHLHISSLCAAGKHFFVVDPNGYIKCCNHSPTQICHWTEVDNLHKFSYWMRFVNSDYVPKMCKDCKHLYIKCDGGCREAAHVYYGQINNNDPCFRSIK